MLGHVLIYILSLNFKKQAVIASVEKLTSISILTLHFLIIKIIHEMFGDIENAHPNINGSIEEQMAARLSSIILALAKAGLATKRFSLTFSSACTSWTMTRFRRFSIVFPKTELFMSL